MIRLADNSEHSLLRVMSLTISHIKEKVLIKLKEVLGTHLNESKLLWVLTVPAMWTEYGKRFMRRCAHLGGLIESEDSDRLILALEPEAAVASCLNDVNPLIKLENGTKFVMLDCGGGTVDITSHVIASGGYNGCCSSDEEEGVVEEEDKSLNDVNAVGALCLNELVPPRGGDCGSMKVDENFLNSFLKLFLGEHLFAKLEGLIDCKHQLMDEFESKVKKKHGAVVKCARLNFACVDELFEGSFLLLCFLYFRSFSVIYWCDDG
jgi:hypothetical protein